MLNEDLLSNRYKKYKAKVFKLLSNIGVDVLKHQHKIETWVRDFYIDEYSPEDCADACRSYVMESLKNTGDNMTFEDRIELAEAKRIAREAGYKIMRESKEDNEINEAITVLKKCGYNVIEGESLNEAQMKRKYQQDSYAKTFNIKQKTPVSRALWDLYYPTASGANDLLVDGIEAMKAEFIERIKNSDAQDKTKKDTTAVIKKFKKADLLWAWGWQQTGEGEGGRAVRRVKPTDPGYRPQA